MATYPTQFLPWWGIFDDSPTPGLFNGTLYEVLQNTTQTQNKAEVSAMGFNITCGYLPAHITWVDLPSLDVLQSEAQNGTAIGFGPPLVRLMVNTTPMAFPIDGMFIAC
jgi:hypothetical protein